MPQPFIDAGYLVRRERLRANMTQAELARRAGTSQPAITRLEVGLVSPTLRTLQRVLNACGSQLLIDARRYDEPDDE
jgi:predicted transcriptional regulator